MAKNDMLKQRILERLGNAGVPSTVLAEVEEVFESAPRQKVKRKTAATRTRRATKRSRKKKM